MTPRRWWGVLAAAGAVFCFAMAGSYCTGCTTAQRAPIERKLSAALTDENLACLIGAHAGGPADVHTAIVLGCAIAPDATEAAITLLELADKLHLGDKAVAGVQAAKDVVGAVATDAGGD